MQLSWAVRTDPGLRRSSNEDSYCARPDLGLFVVADGMGGHVAGEVASRLAVETIQSFIAETAAPTASSTWPFPYDPSISVEGQPAESRIPPRQPADRVDAMADASDLRGMATTASAFLAAGDRACVAHVGDSRVYALRAGALAADYEAITRGSRSRSAPARSRPTAARQHPWRNVVTRALAGGDDPEIDVTELAPAAGRAVSALLRRPVRRRGERRDRVRSSPIRDGRLRGDLHQADRWPNAGGGPDNITALVLSSRCSLTSRSCPATGR